MRATLALCVLYLACNPAFGGVYKCTADGKVFYSDMPCADPKERETGRLDKAPKREEPVDLEQLRAEIATLPSGEHGKGRTRKTIERGVEGEVVEKCLDKWRPTLRDPQSAMSVSARIDELQNLERPDKAPWREVVIDGRAKNGFGGYGTMIFVCGAGQSAQENDELVEYYQALHQLDMSFDSGDRYIE